MVGIPLISLRVAFSMAVCAVVNSSVHGQDYFFLYVKDSPDNTNATTKNAPKQKARGF